MSKQTELAQLGDAVTVDNSGNVGINVTPFTKLNVKGDNNSNVMVVDAQGTAPNYILDVRDDGTSRVRVDGNGKLGIGTTSLSSSLEISAPTSTTPLTIKAATDGSNYTTIKNAASNDVGYIGIGSSLVPSGSADDFVLRAQRDHLIFMSGGNSERARINSSGDLLVGKSSTDTDVTGIELRANNLLSSTRASSECLFLNRKTSNGSIAVFAKDGTSVGSISVTGSSTAYNTSSDYRLKENVTDITNSITRVKQLAPKRFNFIIDPDTTVDGFLAHEAQAVVPEAVTGEHNEVDDDNNPVMQGIDQGKLVPLLTAALQEAIAKIETLETKVAALEAE